MKSMTILRILACGLMLLLVLPAEANSVRIFTLSADDWERPRSGQQIPRLEAVNAAVSYWEKGVNASLLITYPGEDSGEIWAAELFSWLVSLGIPADYIMRQAGSLAVDEIRILVGNREELLQ